MFKMKNPARSQEAHLSLSFIHHPIKKTVPEIKEQQIWKQSLKKKKDIHRLLSFLEF